MSAPPRPKKSLGQHFLHDRAIAGRIVDLLGLTSRDFVLEIGPGAGALSEIIEAAKPARFVVLEKDAWWARERGGANCQAVIADALRFHWSRLPQGCKVIGNLPYNIASPLLWDFASRAPAPGGAVFMVQKEVARRIAAMPGSRAYGALSVWMRLHARPRIAFEVGPGAFRPPPRVDSAVFSLEFPAQGRKNAPPGLAALLHLCFQNRRKQLGGIFRRAGLPAGLLAGFDPNLRPENLSPDDFLLIANRGREFFEAEGVKEPGRERGAGAD